MVLQLLTRLEDVADLASRPAWCDRLAQCARSTLEELAALLAYVEQSSSDNSLQSLAFDLKLVSELLDCLERHGGTSYARGRKLSPPRPVAEPESEVVQLRDTVEQLTVQMSLMERSFREEYAEMSMSRAQSSADADANARVVLSQQVVQLQADLTTADEQHSAELKELANAELKHTAAARKLEESEAQAAQKLAALESQAEAER